MKKYLTPVTSESMVLTFRVSKTTKELYDAIQRDAKSQGLKVNIEEVLIEVLSLVAEELS
jgi:hypothetical protein